MEFVSSIELEILSRWGNNFTGAFSYRGHKINIPTYKLNDKMSQINKITYRI